MDQITGALIGIATVLSAVFMPMAFLSGSSGVIYRQFSITIVSAMVLSVTVAIVVTPALCATLLKPHFGNPARARRCVRRVQPPVRPGQWPLCGCGATPDRPPRRYMLIYAAIVALVVVAFLKIPSGFLPDEDQGLLFTLIQLPPGATQERTLRVVEQVEHYFLEDEKQSVASIFIISGFSFRRQRSEYGHGLHFAQTLERAAWSRPQGLRRGGTGHAAFHEAARCPGVHVLATRGSGTR
jgi:multidrug efflux pump